MQRRNSVQISYYFSLLLVGVVLSAVSRRLEPLYVVLPLVIALLYSRLTRVEPRLTVHCHVAPLRVFEGDHIGVRIAVRAETALPPTELWHLLPPEATCPTGRHRVIFTLQAGEERTFRHEVVFPHRGKYMLGRLYSRVHPGPDLQPLLGAYRHDQECHVYPHVTPLPRHLPPMHTHASFGNYVSRTAGEGLEFAGIRPYNSGDRVRRVHWRTSLVRQHLYVTDYYSERNADVVILLDTLVSLGSPQLNTLDVGVRAAASLAAHYLYHKDRVGLIHYAGVCTWLSPAAGQVQLYRILDALLGAHSLFSYLTGDIARIPPRVLPPGALIFVITTMLDPRIDVALRDLLVRGFQFVLLIISPAQVMPASRRPQHAEASARLWRLEMDLRLHELRRMGVPVVIQDAEDPLAGLYPMMSRGRLWPRVR
ncbi:MAG TPA: DUF58 domain-containing protein [Candidatus Tectomicrobia bacterium]|nr:DUF58 domain-containing protein [Candidatus Tectomicrobia bacterium]